MTAKDKDKILAQIADNARPSQIERLGECLHEFESDGLVKVIRATDKSIIRIFTTPKCDTFLNCGGYAAAAKQKRKEKFINAAWFVAGVVVTKLFDVLSEMLFP